MSVTVQRVIQSVLLSVRKGLDWVIAAEVSHDLITSYILTWYATALAEEGILARHTSWLTMTARDGYQ